MASFLDRVFARPVALGIYGLAAMAIGLVGLIWGDFLAVWQPVPKSLPGRTALAYAVAAVILLAGLALQRKRSAAAGALALTVLYAIGTVALHVPSILAHPAVFQAWSGTAEQVALVAGGMVACAFCMQITPQSAQRTIRIAQIIFGICLLLFGLAHIEYLKATADFVPAWIPPGQKFWAYATAAGHIAAGVAIISGVAARPAAMLLTAMFIVFGLLVHAPLVFADPHAHFNWAANAMNTALIGAAWLIAASIGTAATRSVAPASA
ncbi:MAG TPA: DoxX family membrane protein [Steroidobacteraceae bacterium]|nr:DoxX family membrane protein [Steroidobacteraceae bacterium]